MASLLTGSPKTDGDVLYGNGLFGPTINDLACKFFIQQCPSSPKGVLGGVLQCLCRKASHGDAWPLESDETYETFY